MKRFFLLSGLAAALCACTGNSDNNKSLDYENIDVNFSLKSSLDIPEGTEFGVVALCSRDGQTGVNMSSKQVTSYKIAGTGDVRNLVMTSESDRIEARKSDHGFSFYAIYPYKESFDAEAMPVSLPAEQEYGRGVLSYLPIFASRKAVSVLPAVEFSTSTPFAVLNLSIPADIIEEGVPATLKSVTFSPSDESFDGALAGEGIMNMEAGEFSLTSGKSKEITLTFPGGGLKLEGSGTVLPAVVLPFVNPEGGFDITFTDVNGKTNQTAFLNQDSDAGKVVSAGDIVSVTVTRSSDGVVPVTFPVVFPLGKVDGVQNFTAALQPKWVSSGYWSCTSQPQAYCQWNKASDPLDNISQKLETVNSGEISSPGIKGIWTGDNFEFVIPVKKFAAGSKVTVKFPMYGRQQPVFWYIRYLDGEEWKIADLQKITAKDENYGMECTFAAVRGGIVVEKTLEFENAVKSGYLRIKIECADGSVQAAADAKYEKRTAPYYSGSAYGAPFYLYCAGSGVTSVSFSLE